MILHRRCCVKGDFSIFSFSGAGLQCCIWPDRKHAATYIQRLPHLFFPQRSLHLLNLLYTLLTETLLPLLFLRARGGTSCSCCAGAAIAGLTEKERREVRSRLSIFKRGHHIRSKTQLSYLRTSGMQV